MSFTKRIEALEVAAIKADGPKRFDVIRTIIERDRSIVKVLRRGDGGALVPVSGDALAGIRRGR